MLRKIREIIRNYFTQATYASEEQTPPLKPNVNRTPRTRNRRYRRVEIAPSERFVWGMVALIIALVGLMLLEASNLTVTGTINNELLAVISGIVGSLITAFLMGKKK
jgi:hypothetical protein